MLDIQLVPTFCPSYKYQEGILNMKDGRTHRWKAMLTINSILDIIY